MLLAMLDRDNVSAAAEPNDASDRDCSQLEEPLLPQQHDLRCSNHLPPEQQPALRQNGGSGPFIDEQPPPVGSEQQHGNSHQEWDGMSWRTSLLLKSLYFLNGLGASTWGRFAPIFYNLHGLSSQQIGLLEGCMPAIRTLSGPLWGILSDRYRARKEIYLANKVAGTLLLLSLALPMVSRSTRRLFFVSLAGVAFSSSGLLDAYCLDLLGDAHKIKYGRYRMWTAFSWGLGSVVMGVITDHFGFEWNFILYGTMGAMSIALIAWSVPSQQASPEEREEHGKICELLRLLVRPRVMIFCVELVVMGAAIGTVERLLFLYLINDLGASTFLCGMTVGITVLLELPIFWHSGRFLAVLGHDGMVAFSMTCFVIRVFGYTLLTPTTVSYVLLLETMHGITFAAFWATAMDICRTLSLEARGWRTTVPVVVNTLFGCVGVGIGSIVGGWGMFHYGSKHMYRSVATVLSVTLALHVLGCMVTRGCGSRVTSGKQGLLPSSAPPFDDEGTAEQSRSQDEDEG